MLSLSSSSTQSFPHYKFDLESENEILWDLKSLNVIAYQKSSQFDDIVQLTTETIQSNRFFIGQIIPKRSADGRLKASISFNCHQQTNFEKMQIIQESVKKVTIAIVEGDLFSYHLLNVHAHFDIIINSQDTINGECHHCYFDLEGGKQVNPETTVTLPTKKKFTKTYYKPPPSEESEDETVSRSSSESMDCSSCSGSSPSGGDGRTSRRKHPLHFYSFIFDEAEIQLPMRR